MDHVNCGRADAVSQKTQRPRPHWKGYLAVLGLCCLPGAMSLRPSLAEESHPGLEAEAIYAEAVLAYNRKDYSAAKKALDLILKTQPKNSDALQLLALLYRAQNKTNEAYTTYRALTLIKPEAERGPYYFELASILYDRKQFAPARALFLRSIWRKFNVTPSHLFIGLIDFNETRLGTALEHFEYVARDSDPEMATIGHYYVGSILLKNGAGGLGVGEIIEAKLLAEKQVQTSPTAKSLFDASEKIIAPFDKGQWFASVTLIPQFDSNVSLFPISGPGVTGLWTIKTNYNAGGGYITSPTRLFQLVAAARIYGNFNFVPGTQGYNFHNATPSLFLTYKPMAKFSAGIKAEGTFTVQNSTIDGIEYANRPFAIVGEPGLFLKWQPSNRFQLQADALFRPQYYFSSVDFGGWASGFRLNARVTTSYNAFNPGFGLAGEYNHAASEIWRYIMPSVDLNNLFRIGARDTLVFSGTLNGYRYPQTGRMDGQLTLRAANVFSINKYFTVLADLAYIINTSSENAFSYNRWMVGLGAGFNL